MHGKPGGICNQIDVHGAFGTIIEIGDILVSEDVVCEFFACDYPVCKGACCIVGDSGAPLEEDEIDSLEKDYPQYEPLLEDEGRAAIAEKGFFEVDRENDLVTSLVPGSEACAYCKFAQDRSILCAIELAGCKKPVSCSLYPIRVTKLTGGGLALNLHRWHICQPAFEKGKKEGIRVYQFLRGPLTERFGEEFYEALDAAAQHILNNQ